MVQKEDNLDRKKTRHTKQSVPNVKGMGLKDAVVPAGEHETESGGQGQRKSEASSRSLAGTNIANGQTIYLDEYTLNR